MDRKIAKNIIALFAIQGANFVIPLFTLPYLFRTLGPEAFGGAAVCQAIFAYVILLSEYGFNLTGTRHVAEYRDSPEELSRFFWVVLSAKIILGGAGIFFAILIAVLLPGVKGNLNIFFSYIPMVLGSILFPQWLFQGMEKMAFVSFSSIGARVITVPLIFVFVVSPADAWKFALITAISPFVAGLISLILIRANKIIYWVPPNISAVMAVLRDGWHVFISTASINLYTTSSVLLVGLVCGPAGAGYYAAADKLRGAIQSAFTPIGNAVYPRISRLIGRDYDAAFLIIRKYMRFQIVTTLIVVVICAAYAPLIVDLIMGRRFEGAVAAFRILCFVPFFVGLSNVFGVQTMLPLGMKAEFSRLTLLSGLLNVVLIIPLAYFFNVAGAAVSVLIAELFVAASMGYTLHLRRIPIFSH
ncbi:flippase [Paraburkholderia sp. GAS32]|uniref:flippase n=1 Tax=Paraburkholderia sp. GAS32 TaxID=3035129 RepID=UPI003D1C18A2